MNLLTPATILFLLLSQAQAAAPPAGTLEKIARTGAVVIGWRDSRPFSFMGDDGIPTGYQIDLCLRVVEAIGRQLKLPKLTVSYLKVDLSTRIPRLQDDRIDLECSSSTNTKNRQELVAVSFNTFVTGVRLLAPKASAIRSIKDMDGKGIAVAAGSSTVGLLRQLIAIHALNTRISETETQAAALELVLAGKVQAMISEEPILAGLAARPDAGHLHIVGPHLSIEPYTILMRKDDAFEKAVDAALANVFATKQAERIYEKWFNSGGIQIPFSKYIRESFRYPGKYGI